ncbi:MAG: hypothetical protein ACLFWF_01140 [Alphaproteobacteria bacterium]
MRELTPTFPRVALFYWTVLWRVVLFTVVVSFVLGAAFGLLAGMAGAPENFVVFAGNIIGAIVGLVAWFLMLKDRIGKRTGNFRVVMVEADDGDTPAAAA